MTKKGIKLLLLAACCSLASLLQAQISFFAPTLTAEPGTIITIPIKTDNYSDIIAASFSIAWDSTVLSFQSIQDLGIDDLEDNNFGITSAGSGKLGFLWFDLNPISLQDNTTLFSVTFKVTGDPGSTSAIAFTDDPTNKEVLDVNSPPNLTPDYISGAITVAGVTSVSSQPSSTKAIKLLGVSPNPFSEETTFTISLPKAQLLDIHIADGVGKVLYKEQQYRLQGIHRLTFTKEIFEAAGVYYATISSADASLTQKLIFR
ncbi:MAG: cohesin domain-containing protein [Bacteroidota bacterium]